MQYARNIYINENGLDSMCILKVKFLKKNGMVECFIFD